jgi:hypothetical protein
LGDLFGAILEPQFEPPRAGEVRHSWGDAGKAAQVLRWTASSSLVDALSVCISDTREFASP